MHNPEIKATTPLEEVLEITSKHRCNCRGTYCCYSSPFLYEGEAQNVVDYLGRGDLSMFFDRKTISFKQGYIPKKHKSFCIFTVRKGEKQAQLEEIEAKIAERPDETTKEKAIKMFKSLKYFIMRGRMECGIQEVKPMQCRVYHCKMPKSLESWELEYFYVDRNNPETVEEFRKDINKFDLPVLENSVLEE
tara:strand:+ start:61 stop:633 length:573 start_codon:yes stop_codon:yes gene_type:complete